MGILSGTRVVEVVDGWAGPRAGFLLGDLGAEVIHVDRPGAVRKQPDDLVWLRGRRSIAIDLERPEGQALAGRLTLSADVLLTEPGLDGQQPVDWTYAELAAANERLIWCRLTGYGDEGPLAKAPVHDHLVAARYGVHDQPGWREGPTFLTAPIPSMGAALLAFQAIGTALYLRERTGLGQEVTTSLLAGALAFQPGFVSVSVGEPISTRLPLRRGPSGDRPFYSLYECQDGRWLQFGCLSTEFQQQAVKALGIRQELNQLGFGTPLAVENQSRIAQLIANTMKTKPFKDWADLFEILDVPYALAQRTEDLLDNDQVRSQGMVISIDDPVVGPMEQMGRVLLFSDEEWQEPSPAPVVGADTEAICRQLGLSDVEIEDLRGSGVIA